jgi:fructokinase
MNFNPDIQGKATRKTMSVYTIAGIGELLWDVLEESEELGGAPINFSYHAGALGARSYAISTIGDDRRGKTALSELQQRGLSCDHITIEKNGVTGYVLARVDGAGIASYTFPDNVAWDNIHLKESTLSLAENLDAVCFGSLAQRSPSSRQAIPNFLQRTGSRTLKVFDLNIRQHFYTPEIIRTSMRLADVLKLNDDELRLIAAMENTEGDVLSVLRSLIASYDLKLAVLTRGEHGSLLVSPSQYAEHKGLSATIVDTIGAGDSFTAATVLGLLKGMPLDEINAHANRVAAFVCSQKGAMPTLPEELRIE